MKNILKIAILSMVLINCSNNDNDNNVPNNNEPTTFEPQNIDFVSIIKDEGSVSRPEGSIFYSGRQNIIFTNSTEWDFFLNNFSSYELNKFIETDIDFTTYQILVVINDEKQTGGWSIEITTITEFENEIKVIIVTSDIGNDTTIMSQPYHIVKIPKTNKNVVFDDDISVIVIP